MSSEVGIERASGPVPTDGKREVLVVTGTGGIGAAVARRLGTGKVVVLADNDPSRLHDAAEALSIDGQMVHAVPADVSDLASVRALAEAANALGPIRSVVHTAGVSPAQATPERIVMVDILGTAHVLDAFVNVSGPGTVCICIASMAGSMVTLDRDDGASARGDAYGGARGVTGPRPCCHGCRVCLRPCEARQPAPRSQARHDRGVREALASFPSVRG